MNSNDKANYYDNLNNSTIKASKRLTNTAINQMPVEANFIPLTIPVSQLSFLMCFQL